MIISDQAFILAHSHAKWDLLSHQYGRLKVSIDPRLNKNISFNHLKFYLIKFDLMQTATYNQLIDVDFMQRFSLQSVEILNFVGIYWDLIRQYMPLGMISTEVFVLTLNMLVTERSNLLQTHYQLFEQYFLKKLGLLLGGQLIYPAGQVVEVDDLNYIILCKFLCEIDNFFRHIGKLENDQKPTNFPLLQQSVFNCAQISVKF